MKKARLMGFGVALLLAGAAFSFVLWQGAAQNSVSVALAQAGTTPTPSAPTNANPPTQGSWADIVNAFWTALASKLGISADTLKSDVVAAEKDVIEQAVKDGKLTRAQADQLEQRLSTDGALAPLFGGPRGGFGVPRNGNPPALVAHGGFFGGVATLEAVAKALNLKPADLSAQLQSGKTLAEVAKAQNVDEATVKQAIIDAAKARIQREVQDGVITQAQADQELSNLTPDKIDLNRTPGFDGGYPGPFPPRSN